MAPGRFLHPESANDDQSTIALDQSRLPIPYFAPALYFQSTPSTFTERIVFANAAWHLTPRWEVGGGIRVAHDDQDFTVTYGAWDAPTGYDSGHMSETATSWSAFAKYAFTTSVMLNDGLRLAFSRARRWAVSLAIHRVYVEKRSPVTNSV